MGSTNSRGDGGSSSGSTDGRPGFFQSFDVGDVLGKGSFGEVRDCWAKHDPRHEQAMAVKVVDKQSEAARVQEAFQAARDEIDILEGLEHPSIVELAEVFEDDRFIYVVMERVDGGELFAAITDPQAVIMEDDLRKVSQQVFGALHYLHGSGIVHRDVKAQNLLLGEKPRNGRPLEQARVKLIDFGLAARLRVDMCQQMPPRAPGDQQLELVCGTPAMCAPEIWALQDTAPKSWKKLYGMAYGPKVDIWSMGVVIYLALLGRLPFIDKQIAKLAAKVCDKTLLPSFESKKSSDYKISPSCEKFLRSTLEKFQEKRCSAAEALQSPWLLGTTRGVSLVPIPMDVRLEAFSEARTALEERFGPAGPGPVELAGRAAAFEAARVEAEDPMRAMTLRGRSVQWSPGGGPATCRSFAAEDSEDEAPAGSLDKSQVCGF